MAVSCEMQTNVASASMSQKVRPSKLFLKLFLPHNFSNIRRMRIWDHSAGQQLGSKVIDEQNRARNKLREAQNDLEQALKDRDNETAGEVLELQAKHDAIIRAKEMELNNMKKRAEDLYQRTLESLAAAEEENMRLQRKAEEDAAALERQIEAASEQHLQSTTHMYRATAVTVATEVQA